MRIFISYSSKDGDPCAKKLFEVLSKRGHDPFLADHGTYVSEIIWDEIVKEIESSERSIFVVTESSRESKGQKQEYDHVVAKYKKRMAFVSERALEMKIVDNFLPLLTAPKGLAFNDSNLEEKCEIISTHLVKLQDKESSVQEKEIDRKEKQFPKLTQDGLDKSEVAKCINNLSESHQMETVIPEAFTTQETDKSEGLVSIGFNYRLPRKWFLSYDETHTIYSNEHMFRQFGRKIALGERKYLHDQATSNKRIFSVEGKAFSVKSLLERIEEAISAIRSNGFRPKTIFPTINHFMKMQRLTRAHGKAYIKYSNVTPKPRLDSSFVIKDTELIVIAPLGEIPKDTIVFGDGAVRWHIKRYPKHGSLFIDMGNDRLYSKKYVQIIATTIAKCEIDPKGIVVIKSRNDATV